MTESSTRGVAAPTDGTSNKRPFDDESARAVRRAWFDFVDTMESIRPQLHCYCRRLTGEPWSAEDLCQETLLRGFAAVGRGDLHGEPARMRNARAYLFRTATNLWIDNVRRTSREAAAPAPDSATEPASPETYALLRDAGQALLQGGAPKERAAVLLKDVFDFTLEEIAELLSTTVGAVKSALHRGRGRLTATQTLSQLEGHAPSAALVDRFVAAFRARDVAALTDILLDNVSIEVLGVGGGRGRAGEWATSSIKFASPRLEPHDYHGELIVLHLSAGGQLLSITRLEEFEGRASRVRAYLFCPDTLAEIATELGLAAAPRGYHQDAATLENMIATTGVPWF